jgi:hypothetical protein
VICASIRSLEGTAELSYYVEATESLILYQLFSFFICGPKKAVMVDKTNGHEDIDERTQRLDDTRRYDPVDEAKNRQQKEEMEHSKDGSSRLEHLVVCCWGVRCVGERG